jgi:hypothetical protein
LIKIEAKDDISAKGDVLFLMANDDQAASSGNASGGSAAAAQ